jgi:hypothetical protein
MFVYKFEAHNTVPRLTARSIAPNAPLLAAYFTGLLCRHPKLSSQGRTLSAIAIGLGDDLGELP